MSIFSGFEKVVRQAEPLAMHTWFQLGGPAEYFAEPETFRTIDRPARRATRKAWSAAARAGVEFTGARRRRAGASRPASRTGLLQHRCRRPANHGRRRGHPRPHGHPAVHQGLAGLETLIGIPGTVGGGLHGNAGAGGGDLGQWAHAATVLTHTGEVLGRGRDDMTFAYRESSLDELVILEATFQLEHDDPRELTKRMQKHWIVKKAAQPMATSSPAAS